MNKILVLNVQDKKEYIKVKCYFTFDNLLKSNAKYHSFWVTELTNIVLPINVFTLESYNTWKDSNNANVFDDNSIFYDNNIVNWKPPQNYLNFVNTTQTLYRFNDCKCVKHKTFFHKIKQTINSDIYENGIYYFEECVENNSITVGAIQYLKELQLKQHLTEQTDEALMWLYNLTNTLKTLGMWYY